jgi:23S rRNA U2552 (ribose-2'-O)-methylase RlmE/FtsJ
MVAQTNEKEYYYISRYYDPHILVDAVNLSSRNTISKFIHTVDREFRSVENTVDNLLNLKLQYKFLTLYRPFTDKFFNRYEIYYNFNIVKAHSNVLIFGHNSLSDVEAIEYYKLANQLEDIQIKIVAHPDTYLIDTEQKIKHLRSYLDFEYIKDNKLFDIQSYAPKVDLFIDDYVIRTQNHDYDEHPNLKIKYAAVLTALKNLQSGGSFVFFIMNILSKAHADLIIITREFFESYHLYNYEIQAKYKLIYSVVVFIGFKGISNSKYDELHNMYLKLNFIKNANINDQLYEEFRDFNNNVFRDKINFLQLCKNAVDNPKLLTDIAKDAIFTSFAYAKKYNFDILDIIHVDPNDNFIIDIFYDMFFETRSTKYKFINNNEFNNATIPAFEVNQVTLYPHQVLLDNLLQRDHSHIKLLERAIDTRNIIEWDKYKEAVRYYRPSVKFDRDLRKLVAQRYNTGPNSQAWLKLYEILSTIPLINKNSTTLRTFHICEAPGSFISAINHFIKTKTAIKKFEWIANSLNPAKSNSKNTAFGDDYGYMKKYPNNWDFGADNTGDITHPINMDHYKNKIKNVNLITSDCGIPWEKESAKVHELLKIHLAEMILIMYILPINADFVAKMIFPLYRPIEIHLMYTLYNSFEELIFYKPKINIFSKEFYVIGRGYNGVDSKIMTAMRLLMTKFDHNATLYSEIPRSFLYQLATVNHKMCDDYVFNFKKQVYYVENNKELGDDFVTYIKIILNEKNEEWCNDTKIKKINTGDRL